MANFKYIVLSEYTAESGLFRVPNDFEGTPANLFSGTPQAGVSVTRSAERYNYDKNPIASYGPFFTYNIDGLTPSESWQEVDEGIPSDEDGSYVGSLNLGRDDMLFTGSGIWGMASWNHEEAESQLAEWCPEFGSIYWYAEQGTSEEGHIYYVQPYLHSFSTLKVTVAACETDDKGWYHQIRDIAVYKTNGEMIGYNEGSGELSLTYINFEFPITLSIPESSVYDYFLESHAQSVLVKVGYLHTKNSGDNPDNAKLSSVKFSMVGNIYEVFYVGTSGVDPNPSGDITVDSDEQGTTFFKLLMGDK